MAGEVSRLPGAAQKKLESLQAASLPPDPTPTPAAPTALPDAPPAAVTPPAPADGDRITIDRAELNELRAAAEKATTALARAETEKLRREELEHRLTELENAPKATPAPAPVSAPAPSQQLELSAEEQEEYKDSLPLITKVARHEAQKLVQDALATFNARIVELENATKGVATTVQQDATKRFFADVKGRVPNLDKIISHKHWPDYLESQDPLSGMTYQELLASNVRNQRLEALVTIYTNFAKKYMDEAPAPTGYDGISPSGGAVSVPTEPKPTVKLKASDRKKASEDYRKGKLTWDQLQEVNNKFEEADKAGNVDHNA